jgi:hypothetical protein
MPPIGTLQPNETLVYTNGEEDPRYARRVYVFEELTQFGSDPDDDAIKGYCQNATGTPLPADGATLHGLPMLEMRVARFSERRGEATIVVDWGDRFYAYGAAPDVKRERPIQVPPRVINQPFGVAFTGVGPAPLLEFRSRQIYRNVTRIAVSRLMNEADANALYISTIVANNNARMTWRGIERIIANGNVSPVGQTQAYLTIFLDFFGPVSAVPQGALYTQGEYQSLQISALGLNEEYLQPNLGDGTLTRPANEEYPDQVSVFPWMVS